MHLFQLSFLINISWLSLVHLQFLVIQSKTNNFVSKTHWFNKLIKLKKRFNNTTEFREKQMPANFIWQSFMNVFYKNNLKRVCYCIVQFELKPKKHYHHLMFRHAKCLLYAFSSCTLDTSHSWSPTPMCDPSGLPEQRAVPHRFLHRRLQDRELRRQRYLHRPAACSHLLLPPRVHRRRT